MAATIQYNFNHPNWHAKCGKSFQMFDINKDGRLDFEEFTSQLKDLEVCNPSKAKMARAREMFVKCANAVGIYEGKPGVTREEWTKNLGEFGAADLERRARGEKEMFKEVQSTFFDVVDSNNDGSVSLEELSIWLKIEQKVTDEMCKIAFDNIDVNKNGEISREEYVNAYFDVWFSTNAMTLFGEGFMDPSEFSQYDFNHPNWHAKCGKSFQMFDINKDGRLDFEEFTSQLKDLEVCNPSKAKMARAREMFVKCANAVGIYQGKPGVTREEWIKNVGELGTADLERRARGEKEMFKEVQSTFFDAVDSNNDGSVSLEELSIWLKIEQKVTDEMCKIAFDNIDVNKNGEISREEYVNAYFDIWFSTKAMTLFGDGFMEPSA